MKMLRNILELLIQLREDDYGTIHEILKRLIAQQNKGEAKFLSTLKEFLRGEICRFLVPASQPPVGSRFNKGRIINHLTHPDHEFDKDDFELVPCNRGESISECYTRLVVGGKIPANSHLITFLSQRPCELPDEWSHKTIFVIGTWYEGRSDLGEYQPSVSGLYFNGPTPNFKDIGLQHLCRSSDFVLCYKN